MLSRNRFHVALYKLILLKNILETKLHKEKVKMLDAFEKLIINTEVDDVVDENDDNASAQDLLHHSSESNSSEEDDADDGISFDDEIFSQLTR